MITIVEFLERIEIDQVTLQAWIEEEWLLPARQGDVLQFSDADLARALLIRDLTNDVGVNAAGVGIALRLLDQIHGLRSALGQVLVEARRRA